MPDWDIELCHTTGRGRADTRSVTVQDVTNPEMAKMLGINECLQWAKEDDSPIPSGALEYWEMARRTGNLQVYEVLSELESKWNLTFTIKPNLGIIAPLPSSPPAPLPHRTPSSVRQNGAPLPRFNLKEQLAEQLSYLLERQKELKEERKRLDAEYEDNAASLADIRSFLMISAGRPRRARLKKEMVDGKYTSSV